MPDSRFGIWWNQNRPKTRVPGTLILEGDRWVLDLIGDLLPGLTSSCQMFTLAPGQSKRLAGRIG